MSVIQWIIIEKAIQKWVREASGYPGKTVIWDYQQGDRPDQPWISLGIQEVVGVGHDWKKKDLNPTPTAGSEIRVRHRGHRVATLLIQVMGTQGQGQTALRVLTDIISHLSAHEYDIDMAGAGIGDVGAARTMGARGSVLEPRAQCEIKLHLASELITYNTYVQYTQVTTTAQNEAGDELESNMQWIPEEPPP